MAEAIRHRPYRLAVLTSHPIQYQAPLFRALAARPEIDLHVFFCCPWGVTERRDPGFGVKFKWDIPLLDGYRHSFLRNLSPSPSPNHFWGLVNPGIVGELAPERFDALLLQSWALATNWMAWATASVRGLPLLFRGESNGLNEPRGPKGRAKHALLRRFFQRIDAFLVIGSYNEGFYRSYGIPEDRLFWTPYAVDNEYFMRRRIALEGEKARLRARERLPADVPVILYAGKFLSRKRPFDLLEAYARIRGQVRASLVLVGDGPIRKAMEEFVTARGLDDDVRFLGFRNQGELPQCYALADVFVLPSDFETWGLVINEAMCFGLPVITTDRVGAVADLVREGVNGFTYPVGDVGVLAERLLHVLQDAGLRRAMGRHSLQLISRWDIPQDLDGILQALEHGTGRRIHTAEVGSSEMRRYRCTT